MKSKVNGIPTHGISVPGSSLVEKAVVPRSIRDAVKRHCMECNGVKRLGNPEEDCTGRDCYLWAYRPFDGPGKVKRRAISEKQRDDLRARAKVTFGKKGKK